jgi:hypothetical protein
MSNILLMEVCFGSNFSGQWSVVSGQYAAVSWTGVPLGFLIVEMVIGLLVIGLLVIDLKFRYFS